RDVARFLEGKDDELALRLTKEMEVAAAELKFERAAVLRDQIQSLNKVRERQKIISTEELDQDVLGVVRQGNDACVELFFVRKGRLVGQEAFFFDKVAGWSDGEILSAFVRQFYGKSVAPAPELLLSDDIPDADLVVEWLSGLAARKVQLAAPQRGSRREFVAMAEANAAIALQNHLLSRDNRQHYVLEELQRALNLPPPPNCIEAHDLPNIQRAKQQEEVYAGESLQPLALDPTSPALHTLQRVRDEAHRFAITYHKKLRSRRTIQSVLDAIPGVGPTIRTSLLKTLGSARRVREA